MKYRIRWENKNFDDMGTLTTNETQKVARVKGPRKRKTKEQEKKILNGQRQNILSPSFAYARGPKLKY